MTELTRITQSELDVNGVTSAPTVLNGTAEENKAIFDRLASVVLTPRINALIDLTTNYIEQRGLKWDGYYIGTYDANGNTNGIMIKYYDESDGNYKFAICRCSYSCAEPETGQTVSRMQFNKDICPMRKPFPSGTNTPVMTLETQTHAAEIRIDAYPQTGPQDTDEVVYALEMFSDGIKETVLYVSEEGYIDGTKYEKGWQSQDHAYTFENNHTITFYDPSLLNDCAICVSGNIDVSYEWADIVTKSDLSSFKTAATSDSLGMIRIGDRLTINGSGVLSADDQSYTLPVATAASLGGIKIGDGLNAGTDGTLSVKDVPQTTLGIMPEDGHSYTISADAQTFDIVFNWRSDDKKDPPMPTGNGTLRFFINNVLVETRTNAPQGEGSFSARQYLTEGPTNRETEIRITAEDSFGNIKSAVWTVTVTPSSSAGHTVVFRNYDNTALHTQVVRHGGDASDPITTGWINTPSRASTTDTVFTYIGWDKALTNITEDTVITAQFGESQRKYTVTYKNGNTTVQTTQVNAYAKAPYTGSEIVCPGYVWLGWDVPAVNIRSDLEIHAVFSDGTDLPTISPGTYDYIYSDDPNDNSRYTMREFYSIIAQNKAEEYFDTGDKIKIAPTTAAFADSGIEMRLIGWDHYELADNSGNTAKAVFQMTGVMNVLRSMNVTSTNTTSWKDSSMRTYLSDTVYPALPQIWKLIIKLVEVLTSAGGTSDTIISSQDKLFLLSSAEVGLDTNTVPYKNEIKSGITPLTFPFFTTNSTRVKCYYNGTGSSVRWWLRSPGADSSTGFRPVQTSGAGYYTTDAALSYGVSFAFCI